MTTKEERDRFSTLIKERMLIKNNFSAMETIIDYCEETGLELEIAGSLVDSILKSKLEKEAKELKFLKVKKPRKRVKL